MRLVRFGRIAIHLHLLVAVMVVTGCAHHVYKLYPGPERPAEELARLHVASYGLGDGYGVGAIEIDGLRVSRMDYQSVEVEPGRHEIRWSSHLGSHRWESRVGSETLSAAAVADLEGGEEYAVHLAVQPSSWFSSEMKVYMWIENRRTGVVVGGEKKP